MLNGHLWPLPKSVDTGWKNKQCSGTPRACHFRKSLRLKAAFCINPIDDWDFIADFFHGDCEYATLLIKIARGNFRGMRISRHCSDSTR
jgi:hypothetical protein